MDPELPPLLVPLVSCRPIADASWAGGVRVFLWGPLAESHGEPTRSRPLPDWKVTEVEESTTDMRITAQYTPVPPCCPRCGLENPPLYKHDVSSQEFMDTPIHGRRVHLIVQRQRYACQGCEKTFQQVLPDMDERRNMSKCCKERHPQEMTANVNDAPVKKALCANCKTELISWQVDTNRGKQTFYCCTNENCGKRRNIVTTEYFEPPVA